MMGSLGTADATCPHFRGSWKKPVNFDSIVAMKMTLDHHMVGSTMISTQ
jgi:hypothetical protein